jgi:glycerol-3-phosphate acyltransferase PlsY
MVAVACLVLAYVLGSIPSALIVSRLAAGVDIRQLGDGNMGARNVKRTLGWKPGIAVALADVGKGVLPVLLAQTLDLSLGWRIATAFCAVLGHDFPIFAGFRGGQGLATTLGGLLVLAPTQTLIGLTVYGLLYLVTRHSDLSASIGIGLLVFLMWRMGQPALLVLSTVVLILTVPAKMLLDRPRRAHQGSVTG